MGYYYNAETGFYYLQSRYYDPSIGRFINADALASTGTGFLGYNMFAYCNNHPVIYVDSSGERIVGVGVQGEVSIGGVSVGVEFVIYFDAEVCEVKNCSLVMYTYGGYEFTTDQLAEITSMVDTAVLGECLKSSFEAVGEADFLSYFETTAAAEMIRGIFSDGGSATVALFLIDGYEDFDDPSDYSGKFEALSASGTAGGRTAGAYYAYAINAEQ